MAYICDVLLLEPTSRLNLMALGTARDSHMKTFRFRGMSQTRGCNIVIRIVI